MLAAPVVMLARVVVIVELELLRVELPKVMLLEWMAGGLGDEKNVEDVITTDERVGRSEDVTEGDDGVIAPTEDDGVIVPTEADGVIASTEDDGVTTTEGVITAVDDKIEAEETTGIEGPSVLEAGIMMMVEDGIGMGVEAADGPPIYEYVCTGEITGAKMRRSSGINRPLSKKELIPLTLEPLKSVSSGVTVVVRILLGATARNWSVKERV